MNDGTSGQSKPEHVRVSSLPTRLVHGMSGPEDDPGANSERSPASTASPPPQAQAGTHATNSNSIKRFGNIAPIKIPTDLEEKDDGPNDEVKKSAGPKVAARRPSEPKDQAKKLPPDRLLELATTPNSIPMHVQEDVVEMPTLAEKRPVEQEQWQTVTKKGHSRNRSGSLNTPMTANLETTMRPPLAPIVAVLNAQERPPMSVRTASTPNFKSKTPTTKTGEKPPILQNNEPKSSRPTQSSFDIKDPRRENGRPRQPEPSIMSPMPTSIPLPPTSLSTYLQLELSSSKPSPLYIYRPSSRDFPYEPSRVKLERLMNFLFLPIQLEQTLCFGTLACLDAWLYTFTLLPLRFCRAIYLLLRSCVHNSSSEAKYIAAFVYLGIGRLWRRQQSGNPAGKSHVPSSSEGSKKESRSRPSQTTRSASTENGSATTRKANETAAQRTNSQRRFESEPSELLPTDKADVLKGLLIISSCIMLMSFDASMIYHTIRGQAAIKLYVIYNALEVFDRLLAALGQDVLECLFSKEALERRPDGRSKVIRPLWLFLLALIYNVSHAIALFYQVITLNVAVNSYSNALLTLLMSNQFVEIKSTVFKRFEKENLFQITCADVVERFQLWLMLMIIASRNVIETNNLFGDTGSDAVGGSTPLRTSSLLPSSFTLLPSWAGQVMGPFFLVLGLEMLVDWVKHAYITKFNNTRPSIYGRFLDVLAKDYYSYAFAEQNLTKRLGLPVIPLSCLFISASVQTYQMFLSTHLPLPLASPATSLEASDPSHSAASTAEMLQLPHLLRRALGRHVPADTPATTILHIPYLPIPLPSADTLIAWISTGVLAALFFAVLLAMKLALGMMLLTYARKRYASMKSRENDSGTAEGRRVGGWGTVEVDEDKRRWIYEDDPDALKKLWEREQKERERDAKGRGFGGVERYSMVAKRIW